MPIAQERLAALEARVTDLENQLEATALLFVILIHLGTSCTRGRMRVPLCTGKHGLHAVPCPCDGVYLFDTYLLYLPNHDSVRATNVSSRMRAPDLSVFL